MDHNLTIGSKIKALRINKKYTLKQLSEATGLSVGFLSQIERGISSIAIDSLAKIADCLGVSLSSFFTESVPEEHDPVVHSFDVHYTTIGPQIVQAILSHDKLKYGILPRIFRLMPYATPDDPKPGMFTHSGEEYIYILSGVVTVWVDGHRYTLYPGDSMQIVSELPHNWENNTNQTAELLSINYPNPFKQDANAELSH